MAQKVRALASKPKTSEPHGGRRDLHILIDLLPPHAHIHSQTYKHTCTGILDR